VTQATRRIPVIAGPTAGGKSDLAVDVALALGGADAAEIVTADAFQVYRGLDIGTAKPTMDERRGIAHHLIDIVEPGAGSRFTASDWLAHATRAIEEIESRGRRPIVVGGTHLSIKMLLEGMFEGPGADDSLRAALNAKPLHELRAELERVDPEAASRIHPNDSRRTIRAIEVYRLTGKAISTLQTQWDRDSKDPAGTAGVPETAGDRFALITLHWPVEELNRRINARVRAMVERGLVDEAQSLWQRGVLAGQAREALGYKQLVAHFEGKASLDDAIERIKIETRRFAKSQRTWLRRLSTTPGAVAIDASATPREEWPGKVLSACRA
jgi:tRNA dimethylallyltransferase